jgi:PAS domain S-box-containing protein
MSDGCGRILVVGTDDREIARLTSILRDARYQVQSAKTTERALVSVTLQPPDLILLDLGASGFDGFEVCRQLKESVVGNRIPIVFVNARIVRDEWVNGRELGAVDFVSKPACQEELLARIGIQVELGHLSTGLEARVAQRSIELRSAMEQLKLEVAERRRSELESHESETRFRHMADAAPVIVWTSTEKHFVDFRNAYAEEFTGRTPEKLTGGNWADTVHPDDLECQTRTYREEMEARREFQLEYRIRRADGEYRWMLDRGTPRFLPNGAFIGYVGILIDVTDVKNSQERALTAQNLENLRVLAAGIAHDFNTLLGSVLGEADLALSDMQPDSPGRDNVERIVGLAQRSAGIVRLLLTYAGDPSAAATDLVDMTAIVEELVPHLRPSISRKAEIRTNLAPKLPTILAKTLQIRQAVLNLILNAIEALGGEKGTVTITTRVEEVGPDSVGWYRKNLPAGTYVRLEVSDTGHGMTETVQARVFDPYFSTKFLGRGLGLAAVQGIVRLNGGAIAARSKPGCGSTFEVLLPSAANAGVVNPERDLIREVQ